MPSEEHAINIERILAETEANGRGILEAMSREASNTVNWNERPMECLEMYASARSLMDDEVGELVQRIRTWFEPPFTWDEIAERLGVSRQTAWAKYRSEENGIARLRQRPGPRTATDVVQFKFEVNASYERNGEITVKTAFNDLLLDRLPGDGPSWSLTVRHGQILSSAIIRCGETNGHRYYQLRMPKDLRAHLGLKRGQLVDVRIDLLGPLTVHVD